ncbi:SRPBCC domain-containing protein [Salegentibacter sp. HM20]
MERNKFEIRINAPRVKVWDVLWSDETYPRWTSAFSEGSRAKSTWNEGDKIYFLNSDGEGMVARIEKRKDPEIMNFKHIGMIDKTGKEDLESEKVQAWAGARENYQLKEEGGKTLLTVFMDIDGEYKDYFLKTWPKALEKLKQLSEENSLGEVIRIKTTVNAPVEQVWELWTNPGHIENWNAASEDWHTPKAINEVRENGRFTSRMEAKDGSSGFDFSGVYTEVKKNESLKYVMDDKRKVQVQFISKNGQTHIIEEFEPENQNSRHLQKQGWQAILNNFKKYVEHKS